MGMSRKYNLEIDKILCVWIDDSAMFEDTDGYRPGYSYLRREKALVRNSTNSVNTCDWFCSDYI